MPTNRRAAKKLHRENHSVKSSPQTPEDSVVPEVSAPVEAAVVPASEQAHPLMAEVESFLSKRDELAQKLALEIEATEKKLAELKKTAASLFPETASSVPVDRKSKKNKVKAANREAKTETTATPTETVPTGDSPK